MSVEIKYNVELFKIDNFGDGYKNFFYFLLRYFFNNKKFSGRVSKKEYLKRGLERGFTKSFLENVYRKGSIENPFINEIYKDGKEQIIKLKSIFNKKADSNLFVYIDTKLMGEIRSINDFRSLCYIIYAVRPYKTKKTFKKQEYCFKNPSRTINNIGYNFGEVTKDVMRHRLQKAKNRFNDFVITKRITAYNEEITNNKYIVRIPSLYSMKGLRFKRYYNKRVTKPKTKNKFKKEYSYIHHKNIKNEKIIFGDTKKHSGFLTPEYYEHSWYKIKKQIFEKE